jgi:uncharacterized membrane protein
MQLHFRNNSPARLWVAIMFYNPQGCADAGLWGTKGWWGIDPGGDAYVLNTNNTYAYFYAETATGVVWRGNFGPVYVHQTAFESCLKIGDNNPQTRIVGMREVYMNGYSTYTVNLIL